MPDDQSKTTPRRAGHEREILEFLGDQGGFTTRRIALHVNSNVVRRWSQLTRQTLLGMQRQGWIRPMDGDKPVVWCRTEAGAEAIRDRS